MSEVESRPRKCRRKKKSESDEIAKLVADKLEIYFNYERRENRFNAHGALLTTPKMAVIDRAYTILDRTELDRKAKKAAKAKDELPPISPRLEDGAIVTAREVKRMVDNVNQIYTETPLGELSVIHRYRPANGLQKKTRGPTKQRRSSEASGASTGANKRKDTPPNRLFQNYRCHVGGVLKSDKYCQYYNEKRLCGKWRFADEDSKKASERREEEAHSASDSDKRSEGYDSVVDSDEEEQGKKGGDADDASDREDERSEGRRQSDVDSEDRRRSDVDSEDRRRSYAGGEDRRRSDIGSDDRRRSDVDSEDRRRSDVSGQDRRRSDTGSEDRRRSDAADTSDKDSERDSKSADSKAKETKSDHREEDSSTNDEPPTEDTKPENDLTDEQNEDTQSVGDEKVELQEKEDSEEFEKSERKKSTDEESKATEELNDGEESDNVKEDGRGKSREKEKVGLLKVILADEGSSTKPRSPTHNAKERHRKESLKTKPKEKSGSKESVKSDSCRRDSVQESRDTSPAPVDDSRRNQSAGTRRQRAKSAKPRRAESAKCQSADRQSGAKSARGERGIKSARSDPTSSPGKSYPGSRSARSTNSELRRRESRISTKSACKESPPPRGPIERELHDHSPYVGSSKSVSKSYFNP